MQDILAVHDTGSLRAAAELRFLTPSAFTRRVRSIEEAIGAELFDRSSKPLTLRPHVRELIPEIRQAAAGLRAIQEELARQGGDARPARLICQHTLTVSLAPRLSKSLSSKGLRLRIRSGGLDECIFSVLKGDADIALIYEDVEGGPAIDEELLQTIFFGQEVFVPVVERHAYARIMASEESSQIPVISYPRNRFLGEVQSNTLISNPVEDLTLVTIAETGLGPAVLEFVREGLGVGWLPMSLIRDDVRTGTFVDLSNKAPSFRLNIHAVRSNSFKPKSENRVWETIMEAFGATDGED